MIIKKYAMGAEIVRPIGIVRALCKIGMTNLVHNLQHATLRLFLKGWRRWPGEPAR